MAPGGAGGSTDQPFRIGLFNGMRHHEFTVAHPTGRCRVWTAQRRPGTAWPPRDGGDPCRTTTRGRSVGAPFGTKEKSGEGQLPPHPNGCCEVSSLPAGL